MVSKMLVSFVRCSIDLSSVRIRLHDSSLTGFLKAGYAIKEFVSVFLSPDAKLPISGSDGLMYAVKRFFIYVVLLGLGVEF